MREGARPRENFFGGAPRTGEIRRHGACVWGSRTQCTTGTMSTRVPSSDPFLLPVSSSKFTRGDGGDEDGRREVSVLTPVSDALLTDSDIYERVRLAWDLPNLRRTHLPCSNPRSLGRSDLHRLQDASRHPFYKIGFKTDGVRMFLYLGTYVRDGQDVPFAVMIDRAFTVYAVEVRGQAGRVDAKVRHGSLFDGELVSTPHADGGVTYVIFDTVCFGGVDFKRERHSTRVQAATSAFAHPRGSCLSLFSNGTQIGVEVKEWMMWWSDDTSVKIHRELGAGADRHAGVACDGLIFVYEFGPLRAGTQPDMFKWKPAHEHTIDFLWDLRFKRLILCRDNETFVSAATLNVFIADAWRDNLKTHRAVLECRVSKLSGEQRWEATPVCVRTDKKRPNNVKIAELTLVNIVERLSLEEIVSAAGLVHRNVVDVADVVDVVDVADDFKSRSLR